MGGIRVNWSMKDLDDMVAQGTLRGYTVIADASKLEAILNPQPAQETKKRSKYGSTKVEYDGRVFDSRKECSRYQLLRIKEQQGLITDLQLQVRFVLIKAITEPIIGERGLPLKRTRTVQRATEYWADFQYMDAETGEVIVEDVKSEATRKKESYIIKRKLMMEVHKIQIKEV